MQKKSDRDWRNAVFIDEWTFYLKPPRKIEIYNKIIIILKKEAILNIR